MFGNRKTVGETWRENVQDVFSDLNSPELIKPEISFREKRELWQTYIKNLKEIAKTGTPEQKQELDKMFGLKHAGDKFNTAPGMFNSMPEVNTSSIQEVYNLSDQDLELRITEKVPKHAFYDLYNLFLTPNIDMKIKSAPEELRWLERLLFNSNNPYIKTITENVPVYSYIAATELIKQLLKQDIDMNEESAGGLSNQQMQGLADAARQGAQEQMDQMQDIAESTGVGKIDADLSFKDFENLKEYYRVLKDVPLKSELLRDFIKKTLKLSKSYFSSRYTEVEENIFEVDQLEDLEGLENLLPPLDQIALDDIVTHDRIYHTKINVYIDRSGSMSASRGWNGQRNGLVDSAGNLLDLGMAKLTALKLQTMGEVSEIRAFDNSVHEKPLDTRSLLFLDTGGGTDINDVIEHVETLKAPSLVITDMGDYIDKYSPDVYFIGVGSARFGQFLQTEVGELYIKNHQCVKYDPSTHSFIKMTVSNCKRH